MFVLIIILTIPSALAEFPDYYRTIQKVKPLSSPYFQTMSFLSQKKGYNSTVLEMPPEGTNTSDTDINSWYNASGPGISAFGNKRCYLCNQYNLDIAKLNLQQRLDFIKILIVYDATGNPSPTDIKEQIIEKGLKKNIKYIVSIYELKSIAAIKGTKLIYKNYPYYVYEIN